MAATNDAFMATKVGSARRFGRVLVRSAAMSDESLIVMNFQCPVSMYLCISCGGALASSHSEMWPRVVKVWQLRATSGDVLNVIRLL